MAADNIKIIVKIQPRPSPEGLGADEWADKSSKNEATRGTDNRHIEQKLLFLHNDTDDLPDSKFYVFAKVSSFTLDSLK